MDERDLPSSDESDADFVPKEEDYKADSGSEVFDSEASENEDETTKRRKRKKGGRKSVKKAKTSKNEEEEEEEDEGSETKEDTKIDVDALWSDFKKDVNSTETKKTVDSSDTNSETGNKSSEPAQNSNQKTIVKPKGIPIFSNRNKLGGLSKVLNQIGKKDKMSTLQKSQLDWNKFKKNEGIEEEIKTYNKGKDGYLEKQDFLQRTDLRQFEIEKDLRSTRRKF